MRISIEADDPGSLTYLALREENKDVEVFLDGERLKYVVTADDIEGAVYQWVNLEDARCGPPV